MALEQIEGVVVHSGEAAQMAGSHDPWRWAANGAAIAVLFPILLPVVILICTFRFALHFMFGRPLRRTGLVDEILVFHIFGTLFRRPDLVPVYHHVVEQRGTQTLVRQEGEFVDGRMLIGNRVRLRGNRRGGTLVIRDGYNESLDSNLSYGWLTSREVFLALVAIAVVEYGVLVASAPPRP